MRLRKGPLVATAVLALTAGMLLAPATVLAQRPNGGMGGGRGPGNGRPAGQWSGHGHGHGHGFKGHHNNFRHHNHFVGRPFVRPFFPFAIAAAPAVVYAAPYYAPPVSYAPPPVYYDPPPAYYPPPQTYYSPPPSYPRGGGLSVAPMETVVQYSHGRYELRGDGIATPYRWVWIPNPPPPPPVAPPPAAEPPAAPPASNGSNGPAPARQSQLYRWTDAAGVIHWTDRLDAVPERYRAQAKQPRPS
jgi:Domain of unknown function (DUF4124)